MNKRAALGYALLSVQIVLLTALFLAPSWLHTQAPQLARWVGWTLVVIALIAASVSALSLGASLRASPVPAPEGQLQTHGAYRYVRHPVYSCLIVFAFGATIAHWSWVHVGMTAILIVVLNIKARWEEQMLTELHPEYVDYAAKVGRFIPK